MRFSRFRAARLLPAVLLLLTGCNYVHFGRIDRMGNDAAIASENTDLRTERKILQQQLAITQKENEALRAAIDAHTSPSSSEMAAKLEDATRELASLRANYARLQTERDRLQAASGRGDSAATTAALEQAAELKTKLGDTEDKLATAMRSYTDLQGENAQLHQQLDRAKAENKTLTDQLNQAMAVNDQNQSAISQLNTDLLAEKDARARAEQIAVSLRSQLQIVAAQGAATPATSLSAARQSTAAQAQAIVPANPPASASPGPSLSLSTSPDKLRAASQPAPAHVARTYVVKEGDTLEKIAQDIYGKPERWTVLYAANNALLSGGRPLKAGMTLEIPDE